MFINKKNKNIFNLNKKIKKAFTLPEVIVATFISVLMLSFIFIFISDVIDGISGSNNEVKVLSSFYDFTNKLNNYRNVYIT
jgi:prepilin-type N-terminal cleavage/methylation domain-containing protein